MADSLRQNLAFDCFDIFGGKFFRADFRGQRNPAAQHFNKDDGTHEDFTVLGALLERFEITDKDLDC